MSESAANDGSPAREVQSHFILAPLPGGDAYGPDPRLTDEFELIQIEVRKASGAEFDTVDWSVVEQQGEKLLREQTKDLRVACYWCFAHYKRMGWEVLPPAFSAIAELLNSFPELHPRRDKARASAGDWLCQLVEVELSKIKTLPGELRNGLDQGLKQLLGAFDAKQLPTAAFHATLKALASVERLPTRAELDERARAAFPPDLGDTGVALLEKAVELSKSGANPYALRLRRWALWMSPCTAIGDGKFDCSTSADTLASLTQLAKRNKWAQLLEESEKAFLATPHWLDITVWSARAANHVLGKPGRDALLGELRALLMREPELLYGVDKKGVPLASTDSREWLRDQSEAGQDNKSSTTSSARLPDEIREHLEGGRVREAMQGASQWVTGSQGRVRFARSVRLANAFFEFGAPEQAFLVFRGLHAHMRTLSVKEWEPDLFAACIQGYLTTKKHGSGLGPEDEMLLEELSVLDPAAVLGVMPNLSRS